MCRFNLPPFRYPMLLSWLFFVAGAAPAQNPEEKPSIFDVLAKVSDQVEIEIVTDLQLLMDQKNTNEYQDATFTYTGADKKPNSFAVKIRSRGKFRRKVCIFPPLKLNFSKSELQEKGMAKDDELKLVTHCVDGPEGKEFILREYLAYKIYQLISPYHFRVQLATVRYRDPQNGTKINNIGILMEDEKTMANRYQAKVCDTCYSTPKEMFNVLEVQKMALFEYMISNTDWSIPMVRNQKLLTFKDNAPRVLVPYDFDFSGLVNASYAIPNGDYKQTNIRERFFLGLPGDDADLAEAISFFKSKKKEIQTLVKNFKKLPVDSRIDIGIYIDSFYESLEMGPLRRP